MSFPFQILINIGFMYLASQSKNEDYFILQCGSRPTYKTAGQPETKNKINRPNKENLYFQFDRFINYLPK